MSTTISEDGVMRPRPRASIRAWALWGVRPAGRRFLLVTEFFGAAVSIWLLIGESVTTATAARFVALLLLGTGYAEVADRVERLKRYLGSDQVWSNHTSVWAFAGVLLLPPGQVGALVILIYAHLLLVGRRHRAVRPHRAIFGGATVVLGSLAASAVLATVGGGGLFDSGARDAAAVGSALITFTAVSLLIMICGIYLSTKPPSLRLLVPERDEIAFEFATLILGIVTATFITRQPWLTPFALMLLSVLHRSSLVKQLQVLASTDAKTGLLNPVTWQQQAEKMLERIMRTNGSAAVLILDLDHFKAVNDERGHQAGDAVLRAVADTLKQELRGYDLLCRYGGEEFVAFLDQVDAVEAMDIAERIRVRVAELETLDGLLVTGSVGVAIAPLDGIDIPTVLASADTALYRAKAAGRDRVEAAWLS